VGCTDENVERQESQIPIQNRTCEPGTYTISDGRLVFDDDYEFIKTVEFLSCSSLSEVDEWSREFELETAGKAYRDFMELVSDDELTDEEYDDLRYEYHGKILITNLDSTDNFKPLYPALSDFCNLDGEFQIGDAVIKITDNKIISITDPISIDPATVNDQTVTDTLDGLFVYSLFSSASSISCCPNEDVEEDIYANNPKRRLTEQYQILNLTTIVYFQNGQYIINPIIYFYAEGISERRKGIWPFRRWREHPQTLTLDIEAVLTHSYSAFGLPSPYHIEGSAGPASDTWKIFFGPALITTRQSSFAKFRPAELSVCVVEVAEYFQNQSVSPEAVVEIFCP
jgi:hypothetical protein